MLFALQSGRIRGGGRAQLASQEISELQIQRAGRWTSQTLMAYAKESGEGARFVSSALAKA